MEQKLFNKISKHYLPLLKYKNKNNPNLVILFSGVPGSGKTYTAKILEKKYKAIRINKDEIGKILLKLKITDKTMNKETISDKYIYELLKKWPFKNKLIIIDKSIDRVYPNLLKLLKQNKFQTFIIRLNTSRSLAIKRIKLRKPNNLDEWLLKIDEWFNDFKKSGKHLKPKVILTNKYSKNLELKKLYKKLSVIPFFPENPS